MSKAGQLLCTRSAFNVSTVLSDALSFIGAFLHQSWKVNRYFTDFTTVSQQTLTAVKRIAGDSFVFQQDSALVHHVCSTVQLL